MSASLIAGVVSGVAGLLVFLVIHHLWIRPIWFILPPGLVMAALGGLAVGWAYAEIKGGLTPRPWTALALTVMIGIVLAPSIALAQLRPPPLDVATGAIAPGQTTARVIALFVLELLVTATLMGGGIGWLLGRSLRASAAMALAGLIFALGPGHNIPFLGNTPGVGKGLALLAAIVVVSAIVLVATEAWLAQRALLPRG